MYLLTTTGSRYITYDRSLITCIPLPLLFPIGFIIHIFLSGPTLSPSLQNSSENLEYSLGRQNVLGIMSNSLAYLGAILAVLSMFLLSRSFLPMFLLNGKWLTFQKNSSLDMSIYGLLHVHRKFHDVFNCIPCGNSYQLSLLMNPLDIMSYTSSLVLTTLKYYGLSVYSR